MKIWLKFMGDDKILKNVIYDIGGPFIASEFGNYIHEACQGLDEPTPILVSKHYKHFTELNTTTFFPEDFVEDVNFLRLVIETVPEEQPKENPFYI